MNRLLLGIVGALTFATMPVRAMQRTVNLYSDSDGLGSNRVYRIVSDSREFLWFCTSAGLTRFDGKNFLNFNSANGAPFDMVTDLVELPGGDYWVASRDGITRFTSNTPLEPALAGTPKRFRHYRVGSDAASNRVNVIHRDKLGTSWVGTRDGLYQLVERRGTVEFRKVSLQLPGHSDQRFEVFGLTGGPDGSVYAIASFGVLRLLRNGRKVVYRFPPGHFPDELGPAVFHEGVLWFGQPGGLFLLRPSDESLQGPDVRVDDALVHAATRDYPAHFGIPQIAGQAFFVRLDPDPKRSYVFEVHELSGGRLWLATMAGVFEFNHGELHEVLNNSPFNYALGIGQDAAGNVWLATDSLGVAKVETGGIASFGRADGLGALPMSVLIDGSGNVVVPGWPRQLHVLSGEQFKTIDLKLDPRADMTVNRSVLQDHKGEWWIGTTRGLYHFPKVSLPQKLDSVNPKAIYTRSRGQGDDPVSSQFEDAAGDIWFGFTDSTPALMRWERSSGHLYRYSVDNGLPGKGGAVYGIAQDSDKHLWFAFRDGGLAYYNNGNFQSIGQAEGLPSSNVVGITADREGRVWCLLEGEGLVRINGLIGGRLALKRFPVSERVPYSSYERPVFADAKGRIYTGLPHGVDRLEPSTGVITHYGPAEGVPSGAITAITADSSGNIWVCTRKTVVRISPESPAQKRAPPVLLSGLRVSGVDYEMPVTGARSLDLGELPYQKNSVQIDFLSLALASGQSPLFQYKLGGADMDWSTPNPLGTVTYANLSPGAYRFEARRAPSGANSDDVPAYLTFRILQPFWKRGWFVGLIFSIVIASLAAFERYRAAKLRQVRSALAALSSANEALDIESAISRLLAQSTYRATLPALLETICRRTGWDSAVLWDRDRETALLHRACEWPSDSEGPGSEVILIPGSDLVSQAVKSRQPECVPGPAGHAVYPIFLGEMTLGAIELHSAAPRDHGTHTAPLTAISEIIGQWMERLRAERSLRASEVRFRALAETATDAIVTINDQGRIVFCNPSVSHMFGYSTDQMVGQFLTMLIPMRLRDTHQNGFQRYLSTGERRISWRSVELPGLRADGQEIALELSFGEFTRDEARFFTAVIRDVTERKRTEEALRRSREDRIAEIERIRRRIAIDLHDEIGTSLTQISVLSEVARRQVTNPAELERPLETIAHSSRELIDSMSDIVWAINPQRDHLADLAHRMRRFAADTLTACQIEFSIDLPGATEDIKLEGNLRREVFLIFKEALNNAVRHSGCTRAEIALHLKSHSLQLYLRDNGEGFDTAHDSDGHGLASMSGRARAIGARFEIQSQPGQGTSIALDVPLNTT